MDEALEMTDSKEKEPPAEKVSIFKDPSVSVGMLEPHMLLLTLS